MDQIQQFSQAVLNGAGQATPSSYIPEIANAMRSKFALGGISQAGKGMGVVASQVADDEEKRREAARKQQLQELQDKMDPSKYQRLRKDDGGYAFFDPTGKEIDIDTYAKRTGIRRVDVLKDSENPIDQQFIYDYDQMNKLNQAIWSGDTASIQEYKAIFPDLFSNGDPTPEQINKRLLERYPHMFGMGNYQKSLSNLGNPVFRSSQQSGGSTGGGWSPS